MISRSSSSSALRPTVPGHERPRWSRARWSAAGHPPNGTGSSCAANRSTTRRRAISGACSEVGSWSSSCALTTPLIRLPPLGWCPDVSSVARPPAACSRPRSLPSPCRPARAPSQMPLHGSSHGALVSIRGAYRSAWLVGRAGAPVRRARTTRSGSRRHPSTASSPAGIRSVRWADTPRRTATGPPAHPP